MTLQSHKLGSQLGKFGHNQLSEQITLILSIIWHAFPKGIFKHVISHLCSHARVWLFSGCYSKEREGCKNHPHLSMEGSLGPRICWLCCTASARNEDHVTNKQIQASEYSSCVFFNLDSCSSSSGW